jgi:hypothetical protein
VQPSAGFVDSAVVTGAHQQWHEGGRSHRLVGLSTALVASVRGHLHHRLHLRKQTAMKTTTSGLYYKNILTIVSYACTIIVPLAPALASVVSYDHK